MVKMLNLAHLKVAQLWSHESLFHLHMSNNCFNCNIGLGKIFAFSCWNNFLMLFKFIHLKYDEHLPEIKKLSLLFSTGCLLCCKAHTK